jgi:hypothetical protein
VPDLNPNSTQTVRLKLDCGTLYATPDAGHLRVAGGTAVTFTASFPFTVEVTALTGTPALPAGGDSCTGTAGGQAFTLQLPEVAESPSAPRAPAFKYTIRGRANGEAAGKVLDPIIIVDKK